MTHLKEVQTEQCEAACVLAFVHNSIVTSERAQIPSRQRLLDRAVALANMTVERGCREAEAETCQRLYQALIRTYNFTADELASGRPDKPWDGSPPVGGRELCAEPQWRDDGFRSGRSWLAKGGRRVMAIEEMDESVMLTAIQMFRRRLADFDYTHKWIEYDLRLGWLLDECIRRGCSIPA
jgi:hypothetical protein